MTIKPCTWIPPVPLIMVGLTQGEILTSYRPEGFPQWALQFDVAGPRWFGREEGGRKAGRGDLLLIEPGTPLIYGSGETTDYGETYWVNFQPPIYWSPLLRWPRWLPGIMRIQAPEVGRFDEIRQTFDALIATFQSGHPMAEIRTMLKLNDFLLRCHGWLPHKQGIGIPPCLETALGLMSQKLGASLTLRDLASSANLSPSRFYIVFKRALGIGPMQYLARYRMQRACTLLLGTDQQVKQIGAEVGYPKIDQFSARFRKTIGASPQAYRLANMSVGKNTAR